MVEFKTDAGQTDRDDQSAGIGVVLLSAKTVYFWGTLETLKHVRPGRPRTPLCRIK
jgi:hypothetical protein